MALDFPNTPTLNQTFTSPNGTIWMWDGVKWVAITSTSAYASSGNVGRNLIHNPLFNVAQRGAGPWTISGYTLDRWEFATNLDTSTASQQPMTDANRTAIGDESAQYFLQVAVTGNAGAAAYSEFIHRIENGRRLAGKTVTLSFWANASVALKLGIGSGTAYGTGGSPSAPDANAMQIVNLVTAWTRYSVTINVPSAAGRTFGTNNNSNTYLQFVVSSGTTNFPLVGVQSGTIQLWGVQLEVGSVATPLDYAGSPQQQLANCQRFYSTGTIRFFGYQAAGSLAGYMQTLANPMRAAPTFTPTYTTQSNCTGGSTNWDDKTIQIAATVTAAGSFTLAGSYTASADL